MHLVPRDAECLDPCGPPLMSSSITPAFWATCFSQSSSALSCPGSGYMQSVFIPSWPIAHCSSFDVHAGKGHHSCSRFHRASCLYLGFYFVCSLGPYMCAANSVFQEALYLSSGSEMKIAGVYVLLAVMGWGGENNHMHRKIWDFNTSTEWVMQCNSGKNLSTWCVPSPHHLIIQNVGGNGENSALACVIVRGLQINTKNATMRWGLKWVWMGKQGKGTMY